MNAQKSSRTIVRFNTE